MSAIIESVKQDWDVNIYNQKKECPYLVIDNWYTQDELSAVWHELNMYLSQPKYDGSGGCDKVLLKDL